MLEAQRRILEKHGMALMLEGSEWNLPLNLPSVPTWSRSALVVPIGREFECGQVEDSAGVCTGQGRLPFETKKWVHLGKWCYQLRVHQQAVCSKFSWWFRGYRLDGPAPGGLQALHCSCRIWRTRSGVMWSLRDWGLTNSQSPRLNSLIIERFHLPPGLQLP